MDNSKTEHSIDRRHFLAGSVAAAVVPQLRAAGRVRRSSAKPKRLIVVELAGGNDGLNTVVPLRDPAYAPARPRLAIRSGLHALDERFGLHPRMRGLAGLHARGDVATLLAVGYPDPDRSHFRSMDIWQSARPDLEEPQHGWIGLAADALRRTGHEHPALALGMAKRPLALQAKEVVIPALGRLEDYQLYEEARVGGKRRSRMRTLDSLVEDRAGDDALERLLKGTARTAYGGSRELQHATRAYRTRAKFPRDAFGRHCELASRALASPLGLRVLWLRQGGYDTHAGQTRTHGTLLASLDGGLTALAEDLRARGTWAETRILVFSEFGRRVAENQSRGTDHGAAGPAFVLGGGVRGGVHGAAPSLVALDRGDLRHALDFRALYAELLEDWLEVSAAPILGKGGRWTGQKPRVVTLS